MYTEADAKSVPVGPSPLSEAHRRLTPHPKPSSVTSGLQNQDTKREDSRCPVKEQTGALKSAQPESWLSQSQRSRKRSSRLHLQSSLRRLPADYCWQVLRRLLDCLKDEITSGLYSELLGIVRRRDVQGYYNLEDQWGLQSMSLLRRPYPGNPAAVRLLISVIKKHESMALVPPKERKEKCVRSVVDLDASLTPNWDTLALDPLVPVVRAVLQDILGGAPTHEVVAEFARHGPGSTSTISFEDRSSYFKYAEWPYACSPAAKDLLIDVIKADPRWVGALEDSYRRRYRIAPWAILNWTVFWNNVVHDEHSWNEVTSVPKDGRKDRPIAKEPTGNIFLQLAVGRVLRDRLRSQGINLDRQQDRNRQLALIGSTDRSLFTIDLSNASDTVSLKLLEWILPPDWYRLLCNLRSPCGLLPTGDAILYRKVSSMGNGYTFELETVIFLAISIAISLMYGSVHDRRAVFGDDIIGEAYLFLHHCVFLPKFGFILNKDKSFCGGLVLESCGLDAFEGQNIRPVFLKKTPAHVMDLYNDRNRLNMWFSNHLGIPLPATLDCYLLGFIQGEIMMGPLSEEEFDGYCHVSGWAPGMGFTSLARRIHDIPARDFMFRKLMHSLKSCSGEGGKFLVSETSEVWANVVHRVYHG